LGHNEELPIVSLYPGLVRTEAVLAAGVFDLSNWDSPEFIGRTAAALAADPNLTLKSGCVGSRGVGDRAWVYRRRRPSTTPTHAG
jgi:hypothetical protein